MDVVNFWEDPDAELDVDEFFILAAMFPWGPDGMPALDAC